MKKYKLCVYVYGNVIKTCETNSKSEITKLFYKYDTPLFYPQLYINGKKIKRLTESRNHLLPQTATQPAWSSATDILSTAKNMSKGKKYDI